ncbi:MAG: efflux RND transporter periplasmic adaptor subunit [Planctomycetaceae bacterium]|nr:efflux RND transporter periplasmic adaptor subunit [Planctomycetaceae bacterium]
MASTAPVADPNIPPAGQGPWLEQIALLTGALGAALWQVDPSRKAISLASQWGLGTQRLDVAQQQWQGHAELLQRAAHEGASQSAEARFELQGTTRQLKLQLLPVSGDVRKEVLIPQALAAQPADVRGVLELFFDAGHQVSLDGVRGVVQLALLRTESLKGQSGTGATPDALDLLISLHNGQTYAETAILAVNELRRWAGADRVTLCRRYGGHTSVQAISGLEAIDPRSGAVRALVEIVDQVPQDATPPIPGPHPEQGGSTWVWPLNRQEVIVMERWESASAASRSAEALAPLLVGIEQALRLSRERDDLLRNPWLNWLRPLWTTSLRRLALLTVVLVGTGLALTTIEVDLVITAPGQFSPHHSREIFASLPAVVDQIHVAHGDLVTSGSPLLTLSSDELEFEAQKITGELQTIERQIRDLETLRGDSGFGAVQPSGGAAELAAREEELKVTQQGLTDQLRLLEKQRAQLKVVSPIAGTVLTWNVEQLLQGRRIDPTQSLLSVADLAGDWELEVLVPQDDLSAARRALADSGSGTISVLPPDSEERLELSTVDWGTELIVDPLHGAVLPVSSRVAAGTLPESLRPGTTVPVQLKCGRAPVGYVWFRHAIDQAVAWWGLWF